MSVWAERQLPPPSPLFQFFSARGEVFHAPLWACDASLSHSLGITSSLLLHFLHNLSDDLKISTEETKSCTSPIPHLVFNSRHGIINSAIHILTFLVGNLIKLSTNAKEAGSGSPWRPFVPNTTAREHWRRSWVPAAARRKGSMTKPSSRDDVFCGPTCQFLHARRSDIHSCFALDSDHDIPFLTIVGIMCNLRIVEVSSTSCDALRAQTVSNCIDSSSRGSLGRKVLGPAGWVGKRKSIVAGCSELPTFLFAGP